MSNHGEIIGPGTLRFERLLPGPIERVWAYLTESEKRGTWLASGPMEPRVGGKFELNFLHASLSPVVEPTPERFKDMEGSCSFTGVVTRCEPPHVLSYTWAGDSEVTFELSSEGDMVRLALTHRKLDADDRVTAAGWHTHLGILEDNLHHRTPRPFWSTWLRLEQEYLSRLGE
jgi:uncharacterized protein YndB with AHSA1/START domain